MEKDLKSEILSCVHRRIAAGAGVSGGVGLMDHTLLGAGASLMEAHAAPLLAAAGKKKRAPRKKKAELVVPLPVDAAVKEVSVEVAVPAVAAGKRKRKAKAVTLEAKLAEPVVKAAGSKKPNAWMSHLKSVWAVEKPKGTTYSATMKIAKANYKK